MEPLKIYSFVLLALLCLPCEALHLKGTWRSSNYYLFLAKFGFQQTTSTSEAELTTTQGYIYGNISSSNPDVTNSLTFVVTDSEYFLEFYGNRSVLPRTKACSMMFTKLDSIAYDATCNKGGAEDFLRKVPCPKGGYCVDEDNETKIIPGGNQFTFRVRDTSQPRFWYISVVACQRNGSCAWQHTSDNITVEYDIWMVNGDPYMKHINPFEHQFSFELYDTFELYLAFFILYSFLVPIQLYALSKQKHMLPLLLTICMGMEFVGIIFNFIHVFKFAFDGSGVDLLKVTGNFIDNVAQCLFMLLLLLIVKGWTITRMTLTFKAKVLLFTIWGTYTVSIMALFIWNLTEIDLISDIDEWQTWPGWLILLFRICIMLWFLWELRKTFLLENKLEKTRFYLHFGAGFLVWFVYLPIVALIGTQVSALWRYKTILSVMCSADFLSYCVMTHLLWPSRSYLYFNLKVESRIPMEDLEFSGMATGFDSSSESDDVSSDTSRLMRKHPDKRRSKFARNGHVYTTLRTEDFVEGNSTRLVTRAQVEPHHSDLDEEIVFDTIYSQKQSRVLFDKNGPGFHLMGSTDSLNTKGINSQEEDNSKPSSAADNGDSGVESLPKPAPL